jgi:hypothetical protein
LNGLKASGASAEDAVAWEEFGHVVLAQPVLVAGILTGFVRGMAERAA